MEQLSSKVARITLIGTVSDNELHTDLRKLIPIIESTVNEIKQKGVTDIYIRLTDNGYTHGVWYRAILGETLALYNRNYRKVLRTQVSQNGKHRRKYYADNDIEIGFEGKTLVINCPAWKQEDWMKDDVKKWYKDGCDLDEIRDKLLLKYDFYSRKIFWK